MNKKELEIIVKNSNTFNQILNLLKWNKSGGNYKKLKKLITEYNIDISHFLTRKEICKKANMFKEIPISEILVKNSNYTTGNNIKQKLYQIGLKKPICEFCGQDENWKGNKISLILDHIDGDHYNNEIINLRILCPNCNATTSTFAGRNRKTVKLKIKNKQRKKDIKNLEKENKKELITKSGIDFNKKGWGVQVGKLLNTSPHYALKYVKTNIPEFYENCFKHKK